MSESVSVVNLKIKNFMSITDVEIKPGQINVISGRNEQGKTTILKAIESAAKNLADPNLVKRGADQAEIIVELKDEYTIDRKIKSDGTNKVLVTRGHGDEKEKLSSPQTILDRLFDNVAFNPIDLLDPKKRNESIMASISLKVTPERLAEELNVDVGDLPPLDYNKHGLHVLDQAYKYFYQRRAEANKDAEAKKNKYDVNFGEMKSFSEPETSKTDLAKMKAEIDKEQTEIKVEREKMTAYNNGVDAENKRIDEKEKTIAEYDRQLKDRQDMIARLEKEIEEIQNVKAGYLAAVGSLERKGYMTECHFKGREEKLKEAIANYNLELSKHETFESKMNQVKMIDSMKAEWQAAQDFANALSKKVELLRSELKKKMLTEIDMPIEGLEFVDGEFYLNGNTLDLLSSSAALKLAIAIARKLAKRTKLICIDGAEMIDDENFIALSNEIKGDGFTYFITRVGEPLGLEGQKNFKMENGSVVEVANA